VIRPAFAAAMIVWVHLFGTPVFAADADSQATGCEISALQYGWSIQNGQRVYSDDVRAVAHQLDTPVYAAATGAGRGPRSLRFSEYLFISDPGDGDRLKVKDAGAQPIGWVNRNDVVCRRYPMSDSETGLHRRAVVRTATDVRGVAQEKIIYQSLDHRCDGGLAACQKVSRFQWYFIYAEMQGHYLIAEVASLGNTSQRLLGWLPVADGIGWNTALGLRPSEKLEERKGPNNEPEGYACAYASEADLTSRTSCKEILGGMRWFNLDSRIAVLREKKPERIFEVAFTNAFRNPDEAARDPTELVDALKQVDIFFVIDGTKSMQAAIDGVKGIVGKLREKMRAKLGQGGGIIRLGFRVYRDSIRGGKDGVENSEFLALPPVCDKSNEPEFEKAFADVKAFEPPGDDDFPENSFGGMARASADLATCPSNTKLVFVIGDHGYDAEKQKARDFRHWTEAQIAGIFRQGPRFKTQPVLVFIQTPSESATVPAVAKVRYDAAYDLYKKQALEILNRTYEGTGVTASQQFIQLSPGSISASVIDRTIEQVDQFLQPAIVNAVAERLRSGQSLVDIIKGMQGEDSKDNIPIRYLKFVERSLCDRLGPRCRESVFETVNTAFLKRDDDLVSEVMLTRAQLEQWLRILGIFNEAMQRTMAQREARTQVVNALLQDLGGVLQYTVPNGQEELRKFIQFQGGIPDAANSKLMQYSPAELVSSQKVPPCEIDYLIQYGSRKYAILKMILEGDGKVLPIYTEGRWRDGECPGISEKGKNIPNITSEIRPFRLNPPTGGTNYTYLRRRGNDTIFWIPVRYLP
jgi:hypothetical protein